MEIREAIEFLEIYRKLYYDASKYADMDEVMILLQQGEALKAENVELKKYKLIVEGFKEIFYTNPHNWVTKEYYADEIKKLEQKYFPKEVKSDYPEGDE